MTNTEKIAKQLPYLPVSILGRVELWLTFRGLKPAATIHLRQSFHKKTLGIKRLEEWLASAHLVYRIGTDEDDLLHISSHKKNVDMLARIKRDSSEKEDVLIQGKLYGYPPRAVRIFSNNHIQLSSIKDKNAILHKCYWSPYVRYMVRRGYEYEDSLVAQKWADTIRSEVPILAKWFENTISKV